MKRSSRSGRQARRACLSSLEKEFLVAPDRAGAAELAALWAERARGDRDCRVFPSDRARALERLAWFADWGPAQGTAWLAGFHAGDGAVTVQTAETFVINPVFEELFKQAVARQGKGPFGRSVFRVKVSFEIERVTCRTCPCFTEFCGEIRCNSRVEEELAERLELLRRGEALLGREGR